MQETGTLFCETTAREEESRRKNKLEEERKQAEIRSRKRKLAYERNNIQHKYYSAELDRPDWNREYIEYLDTQLVRDSTSLSEEELTAPIMTREGFEKEQAIVLYREKADKAGALWDKALSELSSVTHTWKWEYMDYLEAIKFKDLSNVTLYDAKEKILSYEEFAGIKEAAIKEKEKEKTVDVLSDEEVDNTVTIKSSEESDDGQSVDTIVETVEKVISEPPMVEMIEPVVEAIPIDFTKLTIEERAVFLPVPTDDIKAEYDAYCERMGYTAEKINSIRYKMSLYDEFMEEYNYRERNYFKNENGKEISHKKDKGRGGITSNMRLR